MSLIPTTLEANSVQFSGMKSNDAFNQNTLSQVVFLEVEALVFEDDREVEALAYLVEALVSLVEVLVCSPDQVEA